MPRIYQKLWASVSSTGDWTSSPPASETAWSRVHLQGRWYSTVRLKHLGRREAAIDYNSEAKSRRQIQNPVLIQTSKCLSVPPEPAVSNAQKKNVSKKQRSYSSPVHINWSSTCTQFTLDWTPTWISRWSKPTLTEWAGTGSSYIGIVRKGVEHQVHCIHR